tara:strand:+ start:5602 stop:5748 length:147 start_codon:yes stop_codon:yes gene_type:complete
MLTCNYCSKEINEDAMERAVVVRGQDDNGVEYEICACDVCLNEWTSQE